MKKFRSKVVPLAIILWYNVLSKFIFLRMKALQEFADETGAFGLNLLKLVVPKAEKVFWLVATVLFAAATLKDPSNLVQGYLEEEILTSVLLQNHDSITFDPAPTTVWFRIKDDFIKNLNVTVTSEALLQTLDDFEFAWQLGPPIFWSYMKLCTKSICYFISH